MNSPIETEQRPVSDLVSNSYVQDTWFEKNNELAQVYMRHMLALKRLQQSEFESEREHFYNEIQRRVNKPLNELEDVEDYIIELMRAPGNVDLLKNTAPGVLQAVNKDILNTSVEHHYVTHDIPLDQVSDDFNQQLKLTQAYTSTFGSEEDKDKLSASVGKYKDLILTGLSDKRVGLGIAGSMLGMTVAVGSGPAGIVLGSVSLASKLLDTGPGKRFQQALYNNTARFLEKVGVRKELLDQVTSSIGHAWDKTAGSRLGQLAMVGTGVAIGLSSSLLVADDGMTHLSSLPSDAPSPETPIETGTDTAQVIEPSESQHTQPDPVPTPERNLSPAAPVSDSPVVGNDIVEPAAMESQSLASTPVTVVKGDTLWDISERLYEERYGRAPNDTEIINLVNQISEANQIQNPNLIHVGDKLTLPIDTPPASDQIVGRTDWLDSANTAQQTKAVDAAESIKERVEQWKQGQEHDMGLDQVTSSKPGSPRV